jgi:hypothetical protein
MAPSRTALGAHDPAGKPRHSYVVGVLRHIDQALMSAGIVEARRDQVMAAELTHVAVLEVKKGSRPIRSTAKKRPDFKFTLASQSRLPLLAIYGSH